MLTTKQRGYGAPHRAERERWRPLVESGQTICWRCGLPIRADAPWDLGHDDNDRTIWRGPEHRGRCNRSSAATRGNRMRGRRRAARHAEHATTLSW